MSVLIISLQLLDNHNNNNTNNDGDDSNTLSFNYAECYTKINITKQILRLKLWYQLEMFIKPDTKTEVDTTTGSWHVDTDIALV